MCDIKWNIISVEEVLTLQHIYYIFIVVSGLPAVTSSSSAHVTWGDCMRSFITHTSPGSTVASLYSYLDRHNT